MQQLQQDLDSIRAEQGKLPALVQEVHEALQAEAEAFERQEAGATVMSLHLSGWLSRARVLVCLLRVCICV